MSMQTKLGIHPMTDGGEEFDLEEGTHYTVLAYSMRGDLHVPTVIRWEHNEETQRLDDDDQEEILENARGAMKEVAH